MEGVSGSRGAFMKFFAPLMGVRNQSPIPYSPTTGFTSPYGSPLTFGRAYQGNEIVYAAIELRATSAGEPHIIGRRWRRARADIRNEIKSMRAKGLPLAQINNLLVMNGFVEQLPDHPLVRLLNNPNPFMSRGQMWSTVVMDRDLAGNAYLLKTRVESGPLKGAVKELWRLRPDRVRIIPDRQKFIAGYEYRAGQERIVFPREDVMHFKTRNPMDDYYGQPPLMAVMARVDIDTYMRGFLRNFFERGGASGPGHLLTVKTKVDQEDKDLIRERLRYRFGSPGEWLILDNAESTYQQLGLARGLRDALPKEIDAQTEARIAMVYGIPGSILGLLIGYESSSYANKRQDWQVLWDVTMTPLLSDFDDVLNLSIVPDFGRIDEVLFDLSDIKALQEDVDKLHDRHRKNLQAGVEFWEEARDGMGLDPSAEGTLLIPSNYVPVKVSRGMIEMPEPPALPAPQNVIDGEVSCGTCNSRLPVSRVIGEATVYCRHCKNETVVA